MSGMSNMPHTGLPNADQASQTAAQNKKVAIIVAAILVVIVGLLTGVYVALRGDTSVAEYKQAYIQLIATDDANEAVANSFSRLSTSMLYASVSAFDDQAHAAETDIKALEDEHQKLNQQAVLQTSEAKDVYEPFSKKLTGYSAYRKSMLTDLIALRPAFLTCNDLPKQLDEADRATETTFADCITGLAAVAATATNPTVKDYVTSASTIYTDAQAVYKEAHIQESIRPMYTLNTKYSNQMYKVTQANTTFKAAVRGVGDAIEPVQEMKTLTKFLAEKQGY